ncbi:hypothetical protein TNCV_4646761 [Trichonephila clavipes]|uniref:Uncharacterized protein n=1 Tax=Trichonephila clavipes TaxID=2585209 RepID=A0A8X6ST35_TRICX|nr:hypothetical protein TNCV_4646761 [Trichonephila clavipes]
MPVRIRRATSIKAGKSSVIFEPLRPVRHLRSSDQREVRLKTNRIHTNKIRSSETTELRERRLQNVRISTAETLHADLNLRFVYSLHQNVVRIQFAYIVVHSNLKMKRVECCASGKVKLPELHSPPEPLSTFLSGGL